MLTLLLLLSATTASEWQGSFDDLDISSSYTSFLGMHRVAVSEDGTILVLDGSQAQLVFINPDGTERTRAGARGQGPGEFSQFGNTMWSKESGLFYVVDVQQQKVNSWTRDGKFVKEYRTIGFPHNVIALGKDRVFYARDFFGAKGTQPAIVSLALGENKPREVFKMSPLEKDSGYHSGKDDSYVAWTMDWDPTLVFANGSDFIVASYTDKAELWLIDPNDGKKLGTNRLNIKAVELTDESHEAYVNDYSGDMLPFVKKHATRPEFWPYIHKILVDDKDRIWITAFQRDINGVAAFYVYSKDGKELHKGKIAGALQEIRGDYYYFVTIDEEDTLFLHKSKIPF